MKNNMCDTIDPEMKFALMENDDEVDGVHILAKMSGQFFVPNGKSRNGRYYPKSLWEKVIADPNIKAKLEARMMYGTVGHKKPLDDEALGDGEGSHFMTKMFIDDKGRGMGEAYIVGTPRGKILNTMLRAGSKFFVSSRADGTFKGDKDGMPIVNEDTYAFYNFDFVTDPGFLKANPKLAESFEKLNNLDNNIDDNKTGAIKMSEKLVEHISNENHELKNKVSNLTDEVKAYEESNVTLKDENAHIKSEMDKCEGDKKIIEGFTALGTVEELTEKLAKLEEANETIAAFDEICESVEEVTEALEKSVELSEAVSEMGTVEEIKEALEAALETKESLEEMGTVEEIKEALTLYSDELEAKEKIKTEEANKELAEELGIDVEKVEKLLKKYSAEDIKELHGVVAKKDKKNESKDKNTDSYKKKNFDENNNDENNDEDNDLSESLILGATRAERIAKRLS